MIPPAFIGGHFEFIRHPWVAEFEDLDVENIDCFFLKTRSGLKMSLPVSLFGCTPTPLGF